MEAIPVYPSYNYMPQGTDTRPPRTVTQEQLQQAKESAPKEFVPKAEKMLCAKAPTAKQAKTAAKAVEEWFEKWASKPKKLNPEKMQDNAETALDIYNSVTNQNPSPAQTNQPKVNQIV